MATDVKLGEAYVELKARSRRLEKDFRKWERVAGKEGKKAGRRFGKGFTTGAKAFLTGAAVLGAIRGVSSLVRASSKLEESVNAVQVVFKGASKQILEFGKTAKESVGLSNAEFNQMATVSGALLKATGKPLNEVADLTVNLTKKAADMASVYDTSVAEALTALNAGLRGETEPLRRFATDVTDATLQTFLLSQGITTKISKLNQAQKTLIRYASIMEQTKDTTGDFTNTSGSAANVMRRLQSAWTDFKSKAGDKLLPVLSEIGEKIRDMVDSGEAEQFGQTLASGIKLALEVAPKLLEAMKDIGKVAKEVIGGVLKATGHEGLDLAPPRDRVVILKDIAAQMKKIEKIQKGGGGFAGFNPNFFRKDFDLKQARRRLGLLQQEFKRTRIATPSTTAPGAGAAPAFDSSGLLSGLAAAGGADDALHPMIAGRGTLGRLPSRGPRFAGGGFMGKLGKEVKEVKADMTDIPTIADKMEAGFRGSAEQLGRMLTNMTDFKDILLSVAANIVPFLLPGTGGSFLSGALSGLVGAHSGGSFLNGRKLSSFSGVVPGGRGGGDKVGMMVERGEKINVTPTARAGDESKMLAMVNDSIQSQTENLTFAMRKYQAQVQVSQDVQDRGLQLAVERSQRREARFR